MKCDRCYASLDAPALPGPNVNGPALIDTVPNFDPGHTSVLHTDAGPLLPPSLSPSCYQSPFIETVALSRDRDGFFGEMHMRVPLRRANGVGDVGGVGGVGGGSRHHPARSISAQTTAATTTINEGDYDDDGDKKERERKGTREYVRARERERRERVRENHRTLA